MLALKYPELHKKLADFRIKMKADFQKENEGAVL
jgi:hypothetical protein